MKITEIRTMSDTELASELHRMRRHLYDLRAQSVTQKLESPMLLKQAKRDIARLLTVHNERQSAGAAGNQ